MKVKLFQLLLILGFMFSLTACFEKKKMPEPTVGEANAAKTEEDCDDAAAKKTMEKIKTEEFSLTNTNDAGCSTEEAKAGEIPAAAASAHK